GLDVALSGLSVTPEQTTIVPRNEARAGDPNATRKTDNVLTAPGGGQRVASVTRQADQALFERSLGANTGAAAQKAIVDALSALDQTSGDPELETSPAAHIAKLASAL